MSYQIFCPIEIPRQSNKLIESNKTILSSFWERTNEEYEQKISEGIGCYIFSIGAGGGNKPLYIGMTKSSFRNECFTDHKLKHYNNSIAGRIGVPYLTLIIKMTGKNDNKMAEPKKNIERSRGKITKITIDKNGHKDIDLLETLLIGSCLKKNPELSNVSETTIYKDLIVPGFINNPTGRNSDAINEFIKIIGV
jgi:hypothetical protein